MLNLIMAITISLISLLISSVLSGAIIQKSNIVTVFTEAIYGGAEMEINAYKCISPLSDVFDNSISSINTSSNCVNMYKELDCKGEYIIMNPATPSHYSIGNYPGFANAVRSIGPCHAECHPDNIQIPNPTTPTKVSLYDRIYYKGSYVTLEVKGCVDIPQKMNNKTASVTFDGQTCIELHEHWNCTGDSIQLRKGHPLHYNLAFLDYNNKASSVSLCGYNCQEKPSMEKVPTSLNTLQIVIFGILGLLVLALFTSVIIILRLKRSHKRVVDILTEKEIQEFIQGIETSGQVLGTFDDAFLTAHSQPYDHNYEVPKHLLSIDMQKPLGAGEYAVVYPGRVKLPNCPEERHVAVKTTKPYCGVEYVRAILKEIKTMIYVGPHPRIVELVGCHTENLRNAELYVMTQLCSNGSMEKFVHNNRDGFINLVEKGELQFNNLHESNGKYENIRIDGNRIRLSSCHIFEWSLQIAEGMEYLASKKVIHGDLAARNVLLDDNLNAKISDFGLSKQLYEYTHYIKKNQAPLPWRYLALESLRNLQFSTQSDIWAYGVTVWEIFTLGDTPYPGIVWGESFMSALDDGFRLPKPKYATSDCYSLMLSCWREKPSDRIPFTELRMKLEEIVAKCKSSIATSRAVESKECNDLVSLLG